MTRYAAFLRGINVGGHNLVKMADLQRLFVSLRFTNVKTYIQSGNVMFDAPEKDPHEITKRIEKGLLKLLGFEVKVFVRTILQIEEMLNQNPFKKVKSSDEVKMYVTFLAEELKMKPMLPLISANKDLEVICIEGCDVFSLSRPYKGRSTFPNNFVEANFRVQATTRNWETVKKMMGR